MWPCTILALSLNWMGPGPFCNWRILSYTPFEWVDSAAFARVLSAYSRIVITIVGIENRSAGKR